MSRLDRMIRRLTAQRECLDLAARLVGDVEGPVLELGLGKGRTFDHLRELLPAREIFVFEREVAAWPECTPDAARLVVGDFRDTLPGILPRLGRRAALAHCDFAVGDATRDLAMARWLGHALDGLIAPGGVVVSDRPMPMPRWRELPLPAGIRSERYYMYRVDDDTAD